MNGGRRIGGTLLVLGYLGVLAGAAARIISDWPGFVDPDVLEAATALGLGFAGFACWRWTGRVDDRRTHQIVLLPARWMAAAAVAFAVADASQTYLTYDNHQQLAQSWARMNMTHQPVPYPHYRLLMAGGFAYTLGLIVAAVGFLALTSRAPSSAPSETRVTPYEEPVGPRL